MKVVVTGISGQLGHDVMQELAARGVEVVGAARREMPLTDKEAVCAYLAKVKPDAVVHCAAYTAVDKAEDEPELCRAVNEGGTAAIAEACAVLGAKMIYLSTDYVFPGEGTAAYAVESAKGPRNVYGASKLAGEEAVRAVLKEHFIVRISWVFGVNGKNFIRTMLQLAGTHDRLTVVADQVGSPTYTRDLAVLLADMLATEKYGTYHATNEGYCSWAELAEEVFRQRGLAVKVASVTSDAYPTRAVRPKNSRLSKQSLDEAGFKRLPAWQDAVQRYLKELS